MNSDPGYRSRMVYLAPDVPFRAVLGSARIQRFPILKRPSTCHNGAVGHSPTLGCQPRTRRSSDILRGMLHVKSVSCLSALFALSILSAVVREKVGRERAFRSLQFLFVTRQAKPPRKIHRSQLQPFAGAVLKGKRNCARRPI